MPELFQNNSHSSLIPTKVASEISGYHADYLARLCREKKIVGEQFGRSWLIDKDSLESFVTEQKNRNLLRAEKLRSARRKEYQKEYHKEYRKTKRPIPAALREKIIPVGTVTRAQEFAWRALRETAPKTTYSPKLVALAVALVVVAGSAYASTEPRILSLMSSVPHTAVRFAFESASRLQPPSSFRVTEQQTHARLTANIPPVPQAKIMTQQFALLTSNSSMAALAAAHTLMDQSRVPMWQTDIAKTAQTRMTFAAKIANDPLGSALAAYVGTGELAYNASVGIFNAYLSAVDATGNSALTFAAETRDGVASLPRLSSRILDAYTNGVYAFTDVTPKIADGAFLALYTTGDKIANKTAALSRTPEAAQKRIADTATVTMQAGHPAISGLAANITRPVLTVYTTMTSAEGAIIALPVKTEDTMLGVAGYASSLMDGRPAILDGRTQPIANAADTTSPLSASVLSSVEMSFANFFHSAGALAQAFISSGIRTLAGLFPGGTIATPALTVLTVGPTNTLAFPVPAPTLTHSSASTQIGTYVDNRTIVQNIISNYSGSSLLGSTFDEAVMAVVRPFVNESVDRALVSTRGSSNTSSGTGVSSDGATLTNVTISSGTATLSTLSAGSTTLATTTVTGDLTVSGTITASSLTVGSLSSNTGLVVPFVHATDTAATSTFTNLTADNAVLTAAQATSFTLGSSTFTSLLGTGLSNTGGALTIATSSFSGAGSNFNADLLDGLDSTYFLANAFSTSSANVWLTSKTTDALAEGVTNLYFSDARARSAISVSGVGLSYASTTGILSIASGYTVPLTASTTDWNTAYLSRITAANAPLSISGNTLSIAQATGSVDGYLSSVDWNTFNTKISSTSLSALYPLTYNSGTGVFNLAFGTSTSNTWGGTQTFINAPVLGSLTGFLKASAGVLSTSLIDLSTDVSSTLPVSHGGTGSSSLTGLLKGNSTSSLLTATDGVDYLSPATIGSSFYAYFHATTTDALAEGTSNLYYTDARARSALSSTATGLSYNSSTGAFTLTAGYVIPLSASTTDWNTAYVNRITGANTPLSISSNVLSIAQATGSTDGYLSSTDWNTFNNKISAATFGSSFYTYFHATTTDALAEGTSNLYYTDARATANFISNLAATTSVASITALPSLSLPLTQVTGTLAQANGGTGFSTYTAGDVFYADNTGTLTRLPVGANGTVLKIAAGLPSWGVDATIGSSGGGDGIFATSTSLIYPIDTASTVVVGTNATATPNSIFEVSGQAYISSKLGIGTTSPSTQLSVTGNGLFSGTLTAGNFIDTGLSTNALVYVNSNKELATTTVTGPLTFSAGTLGIQVATGSQNGYLSSTDWTTFNSKQAALTFSYPLLNTANTISLAFGTTTANSWSALQSFNGGLTSYASSTIGAGGTNGLTVVGTATTTGDLVVLGGTSIGNFHVDNTLTCGAQYHTFIGPVGTVGGDECAALNVTQQDINGNVIYRFGEQNGSWAGEFFSSASLVGLNTKTDVPVEFLINGSEKARINGSSGNFGIGTTSPASKLSVAGTSLISGLATFGSGVDVNGETFTDFTGTGLVNISGALSVSTTSFSGSGSGFNADLLDGQDGTYYLARANHTGTQLASTISDFSSTARGLLSSSATGLTYTSGTGVFSLTSGYGIPLTASTTNWNTFYDTPSTRITAGTGLAWTGNTLSSTVSTTSLALDTTYFKQNGNSFGGLATLGTNDANNLAFETNGTTRLTIDTSGNVGIGTTSPSQTFSVSGNAYITGTATIGTLNGLIKGTSGVLSAAVSGTDYAPATIGTSLLYGDGAGGFSSASVSSPLTFTSGTLGIQVANATQPGYLTSTDWSTFNGKQDAITGTTGQFPYFSGTNTLTATSSLFLATSGNVGIGTTSPWGLLSINPSGITGPAFVIGSSTGTLFTVQNSGHVVVNATNPTDWSGAAEFNSYISGSVTNANSGILGQIWITGNGTYNNSGNQLTAGDFEAFHSGTGFVDHLQGLVTYVENDAGVLKNAIGLEVFSNYGVNNIANSYGIKVDDQTVGTSTNYAVYTNQSASTTSYALYNAGTAKSYFGGNVGIGTTTPWGQLSVNPTSANGASPAFVIGSSTATNFIVTNSGNVGIGTTSPGYALAVTGDISATGKYLVGNTQALYLPDQANFIGTVVFGTGGGSLSHTAGVTGQFNTYVGIDAGKSITSGSKNTGSGYQSLYSNTTGYSNTAYGDQSLYTNVTGNSNTATGYQALYTNTGSNNSAYGYQALLGNIAGTYNVAVGQGALSGNTSGGFNTAIGSVAGDNITTGSRNIIIGYNTNAPSATGSDQLNIGNTIYGNLSTNYVGIGTTSPYAQLSLGGGDLVLGAATAGGTPGDLFLPKLGTSAGSFLAVDATGKVISTTTPSGVTSVGGTYPIISSGGTTPVLSLAFGTTTANTWSALQTFNGGITTSGTVTIGTLNGLIKGTSGVLSAAVSGTDYAPATSGSTILRGDGSGGFTSVSVSSPLTYVSGTLGIQVANATQPGYLSSTDWTTFNGKEDAITGTTGQFPYFSATNTLTATSSLFLAASGNVGIGSTTPYAQLSIGQASTTDALWIGAVGSSTPSFVVKSANSNGYVGVGTANPTSPLQIGSTTLTEYGGTLRSNGLNVFSTASTLTFTPAISALQMVNSASAGNNAEAVYGEANMVGAFNYNTLTAGDFEAFVKPSLANTVTTANGAVAFIENDGAGTLTNAITLHAYAPFTGAGIITNAYGLQVDDLNNSGSSTYAVDTNTTAGANNWQIYAGGTAQSYFKGNVGIGTTSPYAQLSLGGGNLVLGAATAGGTPGDLFLPKLGTSAGSFLAVDASGKVISTTTPAATPGGSDTQIQFNNSGAFGGDAGLTYNATTDTLSIKSLSAGGGGTVYFDDGISYSGGYSIDSSGNASFLGLSVGGPLTDFNGIIGATGMVLQSNGLDGVEWVATSTLGLGGTPTGAAGQFLYYASAGSTLTPTFYAYASSTNFATIFGIHAGGQDATTSATARYLTAIGYNALTSNTGGVSNTAVGYYALNANANGNNNTAVGASALAVNTGNYNTAVGSGALQSNTSGLSNAAFGTNALAANTSAANNTGLGYFALKSNSTGANNTGVGSSVLNSNTTGANNTAVGYISLYINTTGANNTALGYTTLRDNTTGSYNIGIGYQGGYDFTTGYDNIMLGHVANTGGDSITTGHNNILLGYNAGIGTSTASTNFLNIGNSFFGSLIATTTSTSLPTTFANASFAIATTTTLTDSTFAVQNSDTAKNVLSLYSNAGSNLFTLTDGGNVGLGTTSPYAQLALGGGNLVLGAATAGGTPGDLYLPKLGTTAGSFLAVDATGKVIATTTPTSGGSGTVSSGTTGQFPYYAASGTTLTATSSLFLASSGNVGIGSTSPAQALSVAGNGYFSGGVIVPVGGFIGSSASGTVGPNIDFGSTDLYFSFNNNSAFDLTESNFGGMFDGAPQLSAGFSTTASNPGLSFYSDSNTGLFSPSADTLGVTTGGTERLSITSTGNIGIGTTSPTSRLEVLGANGSAANAPNALTVLGGTGAVCGSSCTAFTGGAISLTGGVGGAVTNTSATGGTGGSVLLTGGIGGNAGTLSSAAGAGGNIILVGGAGGTKSGGGTGSNGNVALAVTSSGTRLGNVGIGTLTPGADLEIKTTAPVLRLTNSAGVNQTNTGSISFYEDSAGGMTIDYDGLANSLQIKGRVASVTTSLVTFDRGGNVGLGTTSPYAQLALGGGNLVLGAATAGGTPGDLFLPKLGTTAGSFLAVDASGKVIATTTPSSGGSGTVSSGTTGQFPYYAASGTTLTATSSLFLASSGNVGIGTTSPSYALAVTGDINATGKYRVNATQALYLPNQTTFSGTLFVGNGGASLSHTTGTEGYYNTAVGIGALSGITTGINNTALGTDALSAVTTTSYNVGVGTGADTTANGSTAIGFNAYIEAGDYSTALGYSSYAYGGEVVSIGHLTDTEGAGAVSVGSAITTFGDYTVSLGYGASANNTEDISIGHNAYAQNSGIAIGPSTDVEGGDAIALGTLATAYGSRSIAIGSGANAGSFTGLNISIGASSTPNLTDGASGNIALGNYTWLASSTASNQLNIGNLLYGTLPATNTTGFKLPTSGAIGIGTTSPYAKFSIAANNGDTATTLFAISSSTASATTTLFSVTNAGSVITTGPLVVGSGTGTSTFNGNISITGDIVPTADNTYHLGSPSYQWKDVYIGPGSLYVNGKQVIHDVSNTITFSTDIDQNLESKTTGLGNNTVRATGSGNLNLTSGSGNVNITSTSGNLNIGTSGSGQINLGTITTGVWHGTAIDIGSYSNLAISAPGLTLSGSSIALSAGYSLPLTASTTEWSTAYTNNITTATYPLQLSSHTLSLAFGTTTANSWSALQQFNGNASTTQLTVTGNTYLATTGGSVGIGTTTPYAQLSLGGGNLVLGAATAGGTPGDLFLPKLGTSAGSFLAVDATGKVIATTTPSSGGSGTVGSGTTGQFPYYAAGGTTLTATSSLFLAASGKVGIGNTNPLYALDVNGPIYTNNGIVVGANSGSYAYSPTLAPFIGPAVNIGNDNGNDGAGSVLLLTARNSSYIYQNAYIGAFSNTGASTYTPTIFFMQQTGASSYQERARFDLTGNFGLGTTTPWGLLSASSTSATAPALAIQQNGAGPAAVLLGGNVGIGTTSPYAQLALGGGDLVLGAATAGGTSGDLFLPKLGTTAGSFLAVDATGKVIATTTPSGGGGSTFAWTPTTNFGAAANSTSTPIWFQGGLQASSTAQLQYAYLDNLGFNATTSTTTLVTFGNTSFLTASSTNGDMGIGLDSLNKETSGSGNLGFGYQAGKDLTSALRNTYIGYQSGSDSSRGQAPDNVGIGYQALKSTGNNGSNVAIGSYALSSLTYTGGNVAIGTNALKLTTSGGTNTAIGSNSLQANTTGSGNVGIGNVALYNNLIGTNNVAIGNSTLHQTNANNTIAIGNHAGYGTGGSSGIFIGNYVDAAGSTSGLLNIGNLLFGTGLDQAGYTGALASSTLGVGTSSPYARFSIALNNGDTNTTAFVISSSTASATSTLFTVTNAGNVGIGSSSPSSALSVSGTASLGSTTINNLAINTTNTNNIPFSLKASSAASGAVIAQFSANNDRVLQILQPTGSSDPFIFYTANAFTFRVDAVDVLKIDETGNLGVGVVAGSIDTTQYNPSSGGRYLSVGGSLGPAALTLSTNSTATDQATTSLIQFGATTQTAGYRILADIVNYADGSTSGKRGGALVFRTKPDNSTTLTERLRITSSGNIGIGTTSPYAQLALGGGDLVLGAATAGGTSGDLFLPKLGTSAGSFLAVDATGMVIATTTPTGGGSTPGGSDTQIQFNNGGAFGGDAGLTYNATTDTLSIKSLSAGGGGTVYFDDGISYSGSYAIDAYGDASFYTLDTAGSAFSVDSSGTVNTTSGYKMNGTQIAFLPDQTNYTGSLFIGDGGATLSHSSGTQGFYNTAVGIGTLDSNTTGYENTAQGYQALSSNTTGSWNTAVGYSALYTNTTGLYNTAVGYYALHSGSGARNAAFGYKALSSNTQSDNTAVGNIALTSNTSGSSNTAVGGSALQTNTTGSYNTAVGNDSLLWTHGNYNTAQGDSSLYENNAGTYNTAQGANALFWSSSASYSTAVGGSALYNSNANDNTAIGYEALYNVTSGTDNVGVGYRAGKYLADGSTAAHPSTSVYLGSGTKALTATDDNSIVIGYNAVSIGSNSVVIGNTSIATTSLNGYVGIGTTNPSTKLSVNGTIGVGADEIPIQETNFGYSSTYKVLRLGLDQSSRSLALNVDPTAVTGASFTAAGQILIGNAGILAPNAAGTDWMGVLRATAGKVYLGGSLSSGDLGGSGLVVSGDNVGIGTTSPVSPLSLQSTGGIQQTIGATNNGGEAAIQFLAAGANGGNWVAGANVTDNNTFEVYDSTLGAPFLRYYNSSNGTHANQLQLVPTGGNVGIGTTNPEQKLTIESTNFPRIQLLKTGIGQWYMGGDGTSSNYFTLQFNSITPALTVDTAGNVGIGTTNPATTLDVNGITTFENLTYIGASGSQGYLTWAGGAANTLNLTAASGKGLSLGSNGVYDRLYLDTSGNVGIGTTTPTAQLSTTGTVRFSNFGAGTLTTDASGNLTVSSDERLKNVDGSFSRGLADIQKLSPILYRWNKISGLDQNQENAGFSAQNVQTAIPEAVNTDPRGYLTLTDRPILAASVNAIKELAGRTDMLSLATTSLSTQLASLSAQFTASTQQASLPQALTATSITADSLSIAQGVSAGTLTAQSVNASGTVSAARYVVPQNATTFTFGSTTVATTYDSGVLTSSGSIDLYKLASYAVAGVQNLASRTDLLSVKIDDLASRLAALEALNSATTTASTTDTQSSSGFLATLQDALQGLGIIIHKGYLALDSLVTHQLFLVKGEDGTSSTGSEVIPVGATTLTVTNPLVHTSSKIFLTFTSSVDGSWYISKKQEGSFTITLGKPQSVDTEFDYFIIQTDPNAQIAAAGAAQPADATEAPTAPAPVSVDGGPTVTLNGDPAVQIVQGASWTNPGATAVDAAGADLTSSITVAGAADTNTPGLYTITYNVVDSAGKGGQASRVITVMAPTTAPSGGTGTSGGTVTQAPSGTSGSTDTSTPPPTDTSGTAATTDTGSTGTGTTDTTATTDTTDTSGTTASTDTGSNTVSAAPVSSPTS